MDYVLPMIKATQDFEKRQTLYVKLINNEISNNEKKELRELTKKLSSLPIQLIQ